jgi:ribonucleotide monophosphatase NagD (HAD superfamily)
MKKERRARNYIIDMDGVIYRGRTMVPGADRFVERLEKLGRGFLFLTNSSDSNPQTSAQGYRQWGFGLVWDVSIHRLWQRLRFSTRRNRRGKPSF